MSFGSFTTDYYDSDNDDDHIDDYNVDGGGNEGDGNGDDDGDDDEKKSLCALVRDFVILLRV